MSGSATNLPIKLTLDGMPEVDAGLKKVGETAKQALGGAGTAATAASASMGDLRQKVQNFGYQLQDATVQIQGGTSALVALSQQGSQFLGMFGPAGAVAGAALAIGTVAVGFLTAATNADVAKAKGQQALDAMAASAGRTATALREVNDLFLTAGQRAANLANLQRADLRSRIETRLGEVSSGSGELRRQLAEQETFLQEIRKPVGGNLYRAEGDRERNVEIQAVTKIRDLRSQITAATAEADNLQSSLKRLDKAGLVGAEEYGPTSSDPFGVDKLRASFNQKFRIQQEYEDRVNEINAAVRNGYLSEVEAGQYRSEALKRQNDDLKRLDTTAKDAAKSARERAAADKAALGEVTALIKDTNQIYDQEQDRQNRLFDASQKTIDGYKEQLSLLETESGLLSANSDIRGKEMALIKERLAMSKAEVTDQEQIAERLRLVGEIYDKQLDFTQRKNSFDELARVGEQAFDRIGSAITSAFADGSLKAVDFGKITKAVLSEIAQAALRMAVVNPVLNAVFGGARGTISGLMGSTALSSGPVVTDGNGGIVGYVQQGAQAYSAYSKLSGINPTSYIQGTTAINTGWGAADSLLNASIMGTSAYTQAAATTTALSGMGTGTSSMVGGVANTAMYGPATPGAVEAAGGSLQGATGGLTYGGAAMGALGVAGGLYGVYSGIQKGGVGGTVGAVGGAATAGLSAAALASLSVPVYGWIAAAALTILGALLPGQKPSDMTGTATFRTNEPGAVDIGGLNGDRFSAATRAQAQSIGTDLSKLADQIGKVTELGRSVETAFRVQVGARDGLQVFIGEDQMGGKLDEEGIKAVTSAFASRMLALAAEQTKDENIKRILNNGGNSDPDAALANIQWYNTAYKGLPETVDPSKVNSYTKAVDQLNAQFGEIADKAVSLGLSLEPVTAALSKGIEDLNKARVSQFDQTINGMIDSATALRGGNTLSMQLDAADRDRTKEWEALVASIWDAGFDQNQVDAAWGPFMDLKGLQRQSLIDQDQAARDSSRGNLLDRLAAANGSAETLEGQLAAFERRAQAERMAAAKDGYSDQTLLEQTLAEERLAIQRRFNEQASALAEQQAATDLANREQAQQSVIGTLGGITDFIKSMQLDDNSLLSPQSKLDLTARDFSDVAARAAAGDYDAISQFTSVAGNYRNAARDYYGSSSGYGSVQEQILSVAESIGNMSADTLTASAFASIHRQELGNLGDRLVSSQSDMVTEIRLLRMELRALAPAAT